MAGRDKVTTYEQLQAMTPQERREHFRASIVWDLEELDERQRALVDRQTQRVLAREERLRGQAS
jgi:hypothetical protein